jgi:hypothetical protein
VREKRDIYTFGGGDMKERDRLEDLGVDGENIKTDFETNGRAWAGLVWTKIGTSGRPSWKW